MPNQLHAIEYSLFTEKMYHFLKALSTFFYEILVLDKILSKCKAK